MAVLVFVCRSERLRHGFFGVDWVGLQPRIPCRASRLPQAHTMRLIVCSISHSNSGAARQHLRGGWQRPKDRRA